MSRLMRLVDCDPRWIIGNGSVCGVGFSCPEGHTDCRHSIPFTPSLDGQESPSWYSSGTQWQRTGDTFETLTLSPSIRRISTYESRDAAIAAGALPEHLNAGHFCALHIFIRDGQIEFCSDSR